MTDEIVYFNKLCMKKYGISILIRLISIKSMQRFMYDTRK